jgi:Zn-dependent peptidase ImmA (M78 family)/transcriptional regulator with XRE-family HTH domain
VEISLQPALLQWSRRRAGLRPAELARRLGEDADRVAAWERTGRLTLARAEKWAHATHTPFGYLFLPEPPADELPIPDFRRLGGAAPGRPSTDLLDTLYDALERQDWYRDDAAAAAADPLAWVGSLATDSNAVAGANLMRQVVPWSAARCAACRSWEEALGALVTCIEDAGVLVLRNGVVGNNTHRPLDPEEFRGFALADPVAPLLFVNARDTKAAQMFTLAHELGHLFLGVSGITNLERTYAPDVNAERFCNAVAAEFLVPQADLAAAVGAGLLTDARVEALARQFRVSSLVLLRRLRDGGLLEESDFRSRYASRAARYGARAASPGGGGNYYLTQRARLGRRFVAAVAASALEGRTLYRDAYRLLGVASVDALRRLGREAGVAA